MKCNKCNRVFSHSGNYNRHVISCNKENQTVKELKCNKCNRVFSHSGNYNQHVISCNKENQTVKELKCNNCSRVFTRSTNFNRHVANCKTVYTCEHCSKSFFHFLNLKRHVKRCVNKTGKDCSRAKLYRKHCVADEKGLVFLALKGSAADVYIKNTNRSQFPIEFFTDKTEIIKEVITNYLEEWNNLKISVLFECEYIKDNDESASTDANFKTKIDILTQTSNLDEYIVSIISKLTKEIESFEGTGSGWRLKQIDGLTLRLTKYIPLKGGCGITLPEKIKNSKAVINVPNTNEFCFKYSILSSMITTGHRYLSTYDNLQHTFSFRGISFPTPITDIIKFEKNNNVSINVFTLIEDDEICPYFMSKFTKTSIQHFNLLFLKSDSNIGHYSLINNLSRLLNSQLKCKTRAKLFCSRCFKYFNTHYDSIDGKSPEERLQYHERLCSTHAASIVKMPSLQSNNNKKDSTKVTFNNFNRQINVPVVLYADFESLLIPCNDNMERVNTKPWTKKTNIHEICSVCVMVKSDVPNYKNDIFIYTGKDVLDKFFEYLYKKVIEIEALYKTNIPMAEMSDQEYESFYNASHCGICKLPFKHTDHKVKDHCHLTGKFRCAAHYQCNIQHYRLPLHVPVFIHNLSGYDSHPIILAIDKFGGEVKVIPNSTEKYITFSKFFPDSKLELRFVDTYRFINTSLETQIKNLSVFPLMESIFTDLSTRSLLLRKGIYPYNFMNSWEKLDLDRLPDKKDFYNDLTDEHITDTDYRHAQTVWKAFGLKSMRDYCELYMKTDVVLLADVFENFRSVCFSVYDLDAAWYFTAPSLFYDAMLKQTGITLDLLTDYDMYLMIESGIRGGISNCITRYSEANNPYVPGYNPEKPTNYILYIDANNLYGWAQSQYLPRGNFQWVTAPETIDFCNISDTSPIGYILDVDIETPTDPAFHDKFNYLPLLPENKIPPGGKHRKLVSTLERFKRNYVIHYKNLKQALSYGYKLVKINRCISFDQSPWLEKYIKLNSDLRKRSKNKFEKDFFKLANNSVFGRFLLNQRKFVEMDLVIDDKQFLKLVKQPTFKDRIIFNEKVIGVSKHRLSLTLNSPIFVGFSVLELSKTLMYNFYYDIMYPKYGDRMKCCYMDTDSFILDIQTDDVYRDIFEMKEEFDLSNYPQGHPSFCDLNTGIVGKFKDETSSHLITTYVGLKSKLYSFKTLNMGEVKKCKGVKTSSVKKYLSFDNYKDSLFFNKLTFCRYKNIISKKHNLYTCEFNKTALTNNDDKRVVLENNIDTVAIGHYSIQNDDDD